MDLQLLRLASRPQDPALVRQTLQVHAQRRAAGVPTISVLTGEGPRAYRQWQDAHTPEGRPLAAWSTGSDQPLFEAWLAVLAESGDLQRHAVRYLSRRTSEAEDSIAARIRYGTRHSLDLYWDHLQLPKSWLWLRLVLEDLRDGGGSPGDVLSRISELLRRTADSPAHAYTVFQHVCGIEVLPAIWITTHSGADRRPHELAREVVPLSVEIAETAPWLPIAVWAESEVLEDYLRSAPESHVKAVWREGIVEGADASRDSPPEVSRDPERVGPTPADVPDDGARSWPERFLYAQLQARAQTAGLFCLNATLDASFGGRPLEIDLLSRRHAVAVELDGYHHFQDGDAYRRDRRKDLEMQKQGVVVLRFLSEDVVSRLEFILATIDDTIAHQRGRAAADGRSRR